MQEITIPLYILVVIIAIVVGFVLALHLILSWIRRQSVTPVPTDSAPEDPAAPCPNCRKPMGRGLAFAAKGIIWRGVQEPPVRAFSTIFSAIPTTLNWDIVPRGNRGWRCADCSLVLVDYSRLLRQEER